MGAVRGWLAAALVGAVAVACGGDDDTGGTAGMLGTTGDIADDAGTGTRDGGAPSDDPRPSPPPPDPTSPGPTPPQPGDGGMIPESGGVEMESGGVEAEGGGGNNDEGGTQPIDSGVICDPSPVLDVCDQCVQAKCCAEWLGCTSNECAGNASSFGEIVCIVRCMDERFLASGFVDRTTDLPACAAACAVSSGLDVETSTLLTCISELPADGGPSNCARECLNMAE